MAGNSQGAALTAAKRVGLTLGEYQTRVAARERWCTACKDWHHEKAFGLDASRSDGLAKTCLAAVKARYARTYVRRGRQSSRAGLQLVPARTGDKRQARRRVNHLVETGRHEWKLGERRHEYDHHRGYGAEHQLDVEAVCTRCHGKRERRRRMSA